MILLSNELKLMLVLIGSNRDKLAQLIIKKDQPFFGFDVTPFPLLDKNYTDFFTKRANHALATTNKFDRDNDFNHLTPLQRAILTLLIEQHRSWSPFSEESMQYYKKAVNQENLSVSTVQTAIQSLRNRGFIWQSHRGGYALEDQSFGEWFKHKMAQKSL
jgi:hypothetical protein